jgi:hypothetical protein
MGRGAFRRRASPGQSIRTGTLQATSIPPEGQAVLFVSDEPIMTQRLDTGKRDEGDDVHLSPAL